MHFMVVAAVCNRPPVTYSDGGCNSPPRFLRNSLRHGSGFKPSKYLRAESRGLRPGLVWNAPLALQKDQRPGSYQPGGRKP